MGVGIHHYKVNCEYSCYETGVPPCAGRSKTMELIVEIVGEWE